MLWRPTTRVDLPRPAGAYAPQLWGDFAFRRFCTPNLSRHRSPDHDILVKRARFHLRQASAATCSDQQGQPPSLCARARWPTSRLGALRPRLDRRGRLHDGLRRAVSSSRISLSPVRPARARQELGPAHQPHRLCARRSRGCRGTGSGRSLQLPIPSAAWPRFSGRQVAEPRCRVAYPFQGYVLIALPESFLRGDRSLQPGSSGLSPAARPGLRSAISNVSPSARSPTSQEQSCWRRRAAASCSFMPATMLRCRSETRRRSRQASRRARLQPVDDLGHRKILYAPPVVRAALSYVVRQCEPRR